MIKGLHFTPLGYKFLVDLASSMNFGRLSNQTKKKSLITIERINNILNMSPLYHYEKINGIKLISTGKLITKAKLYKLTPDSKNIKDKKISSIYLEEKSNLVNFFNKSDVTIYKSINNVKPIIKDGISYNITKLF